MDNAIKRLREALKPFATRCEYTDGYIALDVGKDDFDRARRAYAETNGTEAPYSHSAPSGIEGAKPMTKAIASQIASEADYFAKLYPHLAELMRKAADELRVMMTALEVIADAPDPGDETERSASYYRIHAAMLKKIAGIALGRPPVSAEAFSAVDQWLDTDEGQAFLKERAARPAAYPLSRGTPPSGDSSAKQGDLTGEL